MMTSRLLSRSVVAQAPLLILVCAICSIAGCSEPVASSQPRLIDLLQSEHADVFERIEVYGVAPDDSVLLFLVKEGGTYVYRRGAGGKIEPVHHAKLIVPGLITKITYGDGTFLLWSGEELQLELVGYR